MKKYTFLTVIIFLISSIISLDAQKLNVEDFKDMSIRNIGPAGMSGRITAIDVDLSNQDRIYVGAASGGVWLSENGGISWEPIFDDQPTLSIGSIKINQNNPNEIWVGTGEGNPRNSHNSGAGIFKSLDGGDTWSYMGLKETKVIHRIIIHEDDSNTVFAAVMGSAWGPNKERGVFKTTDGGKTWNKVLYVNDETGAAEMVVDPNNPNKLFVGMWEFSRKPYTFTSGGEGSGLYVTYDAGANWKKLTDEEGLPKGELGRTGLAISAANSNVVYALIEAEENALYKSTDGGKKFTKHSTHDNLSNRPFYYHELYPDPTNENILYSLWSYVSKSTDGGKTWELIADYGNAVHPDHHAFWVSPDDPSFVIDGNDGGLNISRDAGETWQFVQNLPVGQFYHVNVDNDFPYNVYGGMQDNGSWIGPGFALKSGGIRNYDWQELYFGDGFDVVPRPDDSRYGYAMSQGGNVGRYDRITGRVEFVKPFHPEGEELRFNWNAAIAQDPNNDCGIYYGSQYVHYSTDCGRSWSIISPDLTTNDTLKQKQGESGGLTIDATGAENYTTIIAIAPSPVEKDVIWVGTDDGNLQLTRDGGATWTNVINRIASAPKNAWIPQIEVSTRNAGEAFVVVNNYRQNDWSAHMYHTSDYGSTWRRLVNDSQVKGFVNTVIQDPVEEKLLFLGTDVGLYVSIDKGQNWTHWTEGFPNVQVRDLKIQPTFHDLVIGTFGRAFWVMDNIRPLRELASNGTGILQKDFAIIDGPDAYLTSRRSYDGVRFRAQGEFLGDNKGVGGKITIWNKKKEEKKDDKKMDKKDKKKKKDNDKDKKDVTEGDDKAKDKKDKKKDKKLRVAIINEDGDTIRQFSQKKVDEGLQTIGFWLTEDGTHYPSKSKIKEDSDMPGGVPILPGKYKAVITFKGIKDSTYVNVKLDPRTETKSADIAAKKTKVKEYNAFASKATEAFDQIRKAKESVNLIEKMMVNLPDSIQDSIQVLNKAQLDKIKEIQELCWMEEDLKGIQRNPNILSSMLWRGRRYLTSSWEAPGENAMNVYKHVEKKTNEAVDAINAYIQDDWPDYEKAIGEIEFNPLKKLEVVERE